MPFANIARLSVGEDIDETRQVALPFSSPQPHIALPIGQAVVLLSRHRLEQLAEEATTAWNTEAERLACIDGQRAEALLKAASSNPADTDNAPRDPDAHHLLAHFIEQGQAFILSGAPPQPQPYVTVRYLASRASLHAGRGDILFHLPDAPSPFFVLNWWVS
jgi:hypothetical protein